MAVEQEGGPALFAPVRFDASVRFSSFTLAAALLGGLAAFGFAGAGWNPGSSKPSKPYDQTDLGPDLVTPIDPSDPVAMARASAQLDLSDADRIRLGTLMADGSARLGLIAFFDDMDPDGDAVSVTGAGFSRRVQLGRGLTPVVVPYQPGAPLMVIAVRDGGGSVTAAVMTKTGPLHLRRLLVGESVGVVTP